MTMVFRAFLFALFLALPSAGFAQDVPHWTMVPEESSIVFKGKQMGSPFEGAFKSFTADIRFDPANLAQSSVTADVDIASVDSKDEERDTNIRGKEWFDAEKFKTARFVSTAFRNGEGQDSYAVDGNLTIRDVTLPLSLPFTLVFSQDGTAVMHGSFVLDRSQFHLGTGDWTDTSIIANEIAVDVTVTAKRDGSSTGVQ